MYCISFNKCNATDDPICLSITYVGLVIAVLFVVDSCDVERLPEARLALNDLLSKISLQNAIFLVLANKQV